MERLRTLGTIQHVSAHGRIEIAYIRPNVKLDPLETKLQFDTKPLTRKEKAEAFRFLAAQNLSKRGVHPMFEVKLDLVGRRADVLAIGGGYGITIVEVKSSVSDFNTDKKWADYLKVCDAFYFCSDEKTIGHIAQLIKGYEKEKKIGLMACDLEHMKLEITKPSRNDESLKIPELVRRQIMYKAIVSADVFFGGEYSAQTKPAYSYIDKPYA